MGCGNRSGEKCNCRGFTGLDICGSHIDATRTLPRPGLLAPCSWGWAQTVFLFGCSSTPSKEEEVIANRLQEQIHVINPSVSVRRIDTVGIGAPGAFRLTSSQLDGIL